MQLERGHAQHTVVGGLAQCAHQRAARELLAGQLLADAHDARDNHGGLHAVTAKHHAVRVERVQLRDQLRTESIIERLRARAERAGRVRAVFVSTAAQNRQPLRAERLTHTDLEFHGMGCVRHNKTKKGRGW